MTRKEVAEIFSVMMLAWPGAEVFKGGIPKLGPTIQLWATCLADVDFWTAQQAVIRLCRECKYPPTIADFREQVDRVNSDISAQIEEAVQTILLGSQIHGSLDAYHAKLPSDSVMKQVIDAMGGPACLFTVRVWNGNETNVWNWERFKKTYRVLLRKQRTALAAGAKE